MKYKLIIDKHAEEEVTIVAHAPSSLTQQIEDYIYYYNHGRYQERYNNLAPLEVRAALISEQPQQYPIPENKKIAAYWASIEAKNSA